MNDSQSIAPIRKSVSIHGSPQAAFNLFTLGVDRWWPKFANVGSSPLLESVIEPRLGGRWYTKHEDGSEMVRGHVNLWEPARRFGITWELNSEFKPDPRVERASEVEVLFTENGPDNTRLDLEHRHFERMGHEAGQIVRGRVESGWDKMLGFYTQAAATPEQPTAGRVRPAE